jgi:Leucine-rich repeat (LRR) protein
MTTKGTTLMERVEKIFNKLSEAPNPLPRKAFEEIGLNIDSTENWANIIQFIQQQPQLIIDQNYRISLQTPSQAALKAVQTLIHKATTDYEDIDSIYDKIKSQLKQLRYNNLLLFCAEAGITLDTLESMSQQLLDKFASGYKVVSFERLRKTLHPLSLSKTIKLVHTEFNILTQLLKHLTPERSWDKDKAVFPSVEKIGPHTIGVKIQNSRVVGLGLFECDLKDLPEEISQFSELRELKCGYNRLTSLPEWVGDLQNLERLDAFCNQLESLPESIGKLQNLVVLNLDGNELRSLPETIGQLRKLENLVISDNKLRLLPKSIGNLAALTSLYIPDNDLTDLPDSLGDLTQLNHLTVRDNKLTTLPSSIGNLSQLISIDLSNNRLKMLPPSIGNLTALQELDLKYNQLTKLPVELTNLTKLKELYLYSNKLESLPQGFGNLTLIKSINLGFNSFVTFPENLMDLPQLESLSLESNELTAFPPTAKSLQTLKSLDLSSNSFSSFPLGVLQFSNLEWLLVNFNGIKLLPEEIDSLSSLEVMELQYCQLTTLPGSLKQLTQLEVLDVSHNELDHLPEIFQNMKHLKRLELDNNRLKSLPKTLNELPDLTHINVTNNQFENASNLLFQITQRHNSGVEVDPHLLLEVFRLTPDEDYRRYLAYKLLIKPNFPPVNEIIQFYATWGDELSVYTHETILCMLVDCHTGPDKIDPIVHYLRSPKYMCTDRLRDFAGRLITGEHRSPEERLRTKMIFHKDLSDPKVMKDRIRSWPMTNYPRKE